MSPHHVSLGFVSLFVAFFGVILNAEAVEPTIDQLVIQLGNDNFQKREEASAVLKARMQFQIFLQLQDVKEKEMDAEIVWRLENVISVYKIKLLAEYKVNLGDYADYPQIDEGLPNDYTLDGPWSGWDKWDFIRRYLEAANQIGTPQDGFPIWTNYRVATKIWMQDRIDYAFRETITSAKSEMEFRCMMGEAMERIQADVQMLIVGDDEYYLKRHQMPNPIKNRKPSVAVKQDN